MVFPSFPILVVNRRPVKGEYPPDCRKQIEPEERGATGSGEWRKLENPTKSNKNLLKGGIEIRIFSS
jgi:hypothetical protein